MNVRDTLYLAPALFFFGCAHIPANFEHTPVVPPPQAWLSAEPDTESISDGLLALFDDPVLTRLVDEALAHNLDLLILLKRIREAELQVVIVGGEQAPTIGVAGEGARQKARSGEGSSTSSRFNLSLDVSWEIDLWGRLSALERASKAEWRAIREEYAALRDSVAAEVMQTWFSIIASQKRVQLAEEEYQNLLNTEALITERFQNGLGNFADVDAARTDSARTRAVLIRLRETRREAARTLSILLGRYPQPEITAPSDYPSLEKRVPSGLPADILMTRPDLRAAGQRILKASADKQAAQTALLPSIRLTGSYGKQSDELSELLNGSSTVWNLAGGLLQPLFQGRRLQSAFKQAATREERAVLEFSQAALNAFGEVERALSKEFSLYEEEAALFTAEEASWRAEQKAYEDYQQGLIDILLYLQTQRIRFTIKERLISVQRERRANRVTLALALGKGI